MNRLRRDAISGICSSNRIDAPISIEKNHSALVPILRAEVGVDRVSLWNGRGSGGRPLRSLWLTNSSGLTLDGGSFTVLDAGAFAGLKASSSH